MAHKARVVIFFVLIALFVGTVGSVFTNGDFRRGGEAGSWRSAEASWR